MRNEGSCLNRLVRPQTGEGCGFLLIAGVCISLMPLFGAVLYGGCIGGVMIPILFAWAIFALSRTLKIFEDAEEALSNKRQQQD